MSCNVIVAYIELHTVVLHRKVPSSIFCKIYSRYVVI